MLAVVGITTEIFGKDVRISESHDPEFRDDKCILLKAMTDLPPDGIVSAEMEWADRVVAVNPHWDNLRLLVYPK